MKKDFIIFLKTLLGLAFLLSSVAYGTTTKTICQPMKLNSQPSPISKIEIDWDSSSNFSRAVVALSGPSFHRSFSALFAIARPSSPCGPYYYQLADFGNSAFRLVIMHGGCITRDSDNSVVPTPAILTINATEVPVPFSCSDL